MKELLKLEKKNENTISSVELVKIINEIRKAEGNDIELRHGTFLIKIENELDGDEQNFLSTYLDASNRRSKCYDLPKDEATLMLMSESRGVRKGVLLKLRALEKPRTHLEVLQSEMVLLMENEKLQLENNKLKPRSEFVDLVFNSDELLAISQVTKILKLGYGNITLFRILREKGILFKNKNEPMQQYVNKGYFEVKEKFVPRKNHPPVLLMQTFATQKGLAFIAKTLGVVTTQNQQMQITNT